MVAGQSESMTSHQTYWVLGGGQFGQRAVKLLRKENQKNNIVVIDKQPPRDLSYNIEIIQADGVEWFTENFIPTARVDKIIPALPIHLTADWIKKKFTNEHRNIRSIEVPDKFTQHFPHPLRLSPSRIATSYADFRCPPNCSEPDDCCTYTKQPRPLPLHHLLTTMLYGDFEPLILTSRQFAPGVGGFLANDLWSFLKKVELLSSTPLLIGTACKCHGIIDGLYHDI